MEETKMPDNYSKWMDILSSNEYSYMVNYEDEIKVSIDWGASKTGPLHIDKVYSYNDRAVVVKFSDGTKTKSVCSVNDTFNKDTGIAICIAKRALGKDGHAKFNDLMREAYSEKKNPKSETKQQTNKKSRRQKKDERLKRLISEAVKDAVSNPEIE